MNSKIKDDIDSRTKIVFEIIGSYHINIIYNTIYNQAVNFVNGSKVTISLTNAFEKSLLSYKKNYKSKFELVITELYEYFRNYIPSVDYATFEDKIISAFISEKNTEVADNYMKNGLVLKILTRFSHSLIDNIQERFMHYVIDNRNQSSVKFLQNHTNVLLHKIRNEFLAELTLDDGCKNCEHLEQRMIELSEEYESVIAKIKEELKSYVMLTVKYRSYVKMLHKSQDTGAVSLNVYDLPEDPELDEL